MSVTGERNQEDEDKADLRCGMGNVFYKRLERHILRLKRMGNNRITKHSWVEAAIREKWEREKKLHPDNVPEEKGISLKLPKYLSKGVESIVSFIKKYRRSYSKKQWIVEAIEEKLEQESKDVNNWLNNSGVALRDNEG